MQAKDMWEQYAKKNHLDETKYEVWAFGDKPDQLAELVLQGEKTGTASAYDLYELEGEPLPEVGDYNVILDAKEEAKCIIQITKLYVVPFHAVTESHAVKEGEGDKSLTYWRRVHRAFFQDGFEKAGLPFDETIKVPCQEFKVVYQSVQK